MIGTIILLGLAALAAFVVAVVIGAAKQESRFGRGDLEDYRL